jgi:hypothetical protein
MAGARESSAGFVVTLAAFAMFSLSLAGGETAPTQAGIPTTTSTTTWYDYSCVVDRVVVDPDSKIAALEPGCPVTLEAQAFGPGGLFDVCAWDDAGGFGGECGWDPISVVDGSRFTVEYTPGDELGSEVLVAVALDPHSPDYVCTGDSYGATGYKTFPRADGARDCVVTFRVTDEVDLGEIVFTVAYAASDCEVGGCGRGVACESPVSDWSSAYSGPYDSDDTHELGLRATSAQGFSGPADVYRCDLLKHGGADDPSPDDFVVGVRSARSPPPLSKVIAGLPSIEVAVDCVLGPTTTTTLPFEPASCGHPCSVQTLPASARDALYIVSAAVGARACKTCICDVNRSGIVDATDALTVLAQAVGLDARVRCVLCAEPIPLACQ